MEKMGDIVEVSLNQLTDTQRDMLDLFFFKKGLMGYNVQDYADTHYMSIASVYRERRLALNAFAEVYEQFLYL